MKQINKDSKLSVTVNDKSDKNDRNIGLDLLRACAVFFVISVHFFLNNGFYETTVSGYKMFLMFGMRWLFFICVPLFLLLTGYLKMDKKIDKNHYKSISQILLIYLFASFCPIIFRISYLNEEMSFLQIVMSFFNFSADKYSWYVNMYIGLFLLIPFLNILYKGLDNKKNKQILIISLLLISSMSPIFNSINVRGVNLEFFPNWWDSLYPLTYYFIGCYLKEYQIQIKAKLNIILISGLLLFETTASYIHSYKGTFNWGLFGGYNCIFTVAIATLIFILLYKVNIKNHKIKFLISDISKLSLDIYLFSYIADAYFYPGFKSFIPNVQQFLPYYIIIVFIIFNSAYFMGNIRRWIFKMAGKIIKPKSVHSRVKQLFYKLKTALF